MSVFDALPGEVEAQHKLVSSIVESHVSRAAESTDLSATIDRMTRDVVKTIEVQNVLLHMCAEQEEKIRRLTEEVAAQNAYIEQVLHRANQPR